MADAKLSKCCVCDETTVDPRVLPCCHTYCLECMALRVSGPPAGRLLTCIQCSAECTAPPSLDQLPKDFAAANVAQMQLGLADFRCSFRPSHNDRPAAALCVDCGRHLCQHCVDDHTEIATFQGHALKDLTNTEHLRAADLAPAPACTLHPAHRLTYLCTAAACNVTVCVECAASTHAGAGHALIKITDAAKQQEEAMRAALLSVAAVSERLQAIARAIEARTAAVNSNEAAAIAHTHKVFAAMRDELSMREEMVCSEITAVAKAKRKNLDLQQDGLQVLLQHLLHLQQHSNDTLACCSHTQIVASSARLASRCEQLLAEAAAEPDAPVVESAVAVEGLESGCEQLRAQISSLGKVTASRFSEKSFRLKWEPPTAPAGPAVGGAGAAAAAPADAAADDTPPVLRKAGDTATLVVQCNWPADESLALSTMKEKLDAIVPRRLTVRMPSPYKDLLRCGAPDGGSTRRSYVPLPD